MKKTVVFGFTGVVGSSFLEFTRNDQNFLFTSRKKSKNCIKWNLNKSLSNFPIKEFNLYRNYHYINRRIGCHMSGNRIME